MLFTKLESPFCSFILSFSKSDSVAFAIFVTSYISVVTWSSSILNQGKIMGSWSFSCGNFSFSLKKWVKLLVEFNFFLLVFLWVEVFLLLLDEGLSCVNWSLSNMHNKMILIIDERLSCVNWSFFSSNMQGVSMMMLMKMFKFNSLAESQHS